MTDVAIVTEPTNGALVTSGLKGNRSGAPASTCPKCGIVVATTYLATHLRRQHNIYAAGHAPIVKLPRGRRPAGAPILHDDKQCPECGKHYRPASFAKHLRTQHGYVGNNPPRVMKAAVPAKMVAQATAIAEPATPDMVNDIMLAVAMARWPEGIPPERLGELLEWRAATERLLR